MLSASPDADLFAEGFAVCNYDPLSSRSIADVMCDCSSSSDAVVINEKFAELASGNANANWSSKRREQQTVRRLRSSVLSSQTQLTHITAPPRQLSRGMFNRRCLDLVLRRTCENSPLRAATILSTDLKLSRTSLRTWEVRAASAFISEARTFVADSELMLLQQPAAGSLHHSVFSIRGDATNNINGAKYHVLECSMLYNIGFDRTSYCIWPEPLVVTDCTSAGAWNTYMRQLDSINCPAFLAEDDQSLGRFTGGVLRTVCITADAGSDQKGFQRIVEHVLAHRRHTLVFQCDCIKHHASNGCKRSLVLSDIYSSLWKLDHSFYSAIVKLFHFFKNHRASLMRAWSLEYGPEDAEAALRRALPRPIANRWGTFDACSGHLLSYDFKKLINICLLVSAPAQRGSKRKRNGAPAAGQPVDEIALDDVTHYREKKSKWTCHTRSSIVQPCFWLLLRLTHICRSPWIHLLNFLQSSEVRLQDLVCGKHASIAQEFEQCVLDDSTWVGLTDHLDSDLLSGPLPTQLERNEAIVSFTVCHACDYNRRVTRRLDRWPLLIVWMARSKPDVVCAGRKRAAALMVRLRVRDPTSAFCF